MSHFAVFLILATFVGSGVLGRPQSDHLSEMISNKTFIETFEQWMIDYNKTYPNDEVTTRFTCFVLNLLTIGKLNAAVIDDDDSEDPENDRLEFGLSPFTAMDVAEFRDYLNLNLAISVKNMPEVDFVAPRNAKIPSTFDWRKKKAVTDIKNQGSCGSCWAFSVAALVESLYAIKNKVLKLFSEQQILDCDTKSNGCNGGWMDSAIQSIKDKGGLNTAASYPYENQQGACRFRSNAVGVVVDKNLRLRSKDEKGLADYIATKSPVVNAINAEMLQHYKKGVLSASNDQCDRSPNSNNHATMIVGYGKNFWNVKNSWGTGWGEKGYYRIKRGQNVCGMSNNLFAATVK